MRAFDWLEDVGNQKEKKIEPLIIQRLFKVKESEKLEPLIGWWPLEARKEAIDWLEDVRRQRVKNEAF